MEQGIAMIQTPRIRKSFLILIPLVLSACSSGDNRRAYSDREIQLIDKAITYYGGDTEEKRAIILRDTVPTVVKLPEMSCVAFTLRKNVIGLESVVCFDAESGAVTVDHTE